MKIFLVIGGFIIIAIGIVPLKHNIEEYDTQKNGAFVTTTITYIPNCLGTKGKHFMKFIFAGQIFDKAISCSFSDDHKVGDTIKMKHTDNTDIFLFENEMVEGQFISSGLLGLFGILFIYIGIKKSQH